MNSNHNNKETFKLLNVSESESGSEIPDLSVNVPRRKIKVKRKYRPGNDHKMDRDKRCCSLATMWKVLGVVLLLSLLVAIITLLVHLYDRNDQLHKRLQEIQSESRQFPAEFHDIHSRLKTLEANGTFFWESLVKINSDVATLNKDVQSLKETADGLSKSIALAPQIVTVPKTVDSLQHDVASMGSKISDLEMSLKEAKEAATKANNAEALQEFRTIIDNLNQSMTSRIQETSDRAATITADVKVLQNSSLLLENRCEALENKSRSYEQSSEHLQSIVSVLLNQSDHFLSGHTSASSPTETSGNVTLEQILSHVTNLTKIYHALLKKVSELESDLQHDLNYNLLNNNVTTGLELMMTEALKSSEFKMLETLQNESLRVYIIEQQLGMLISQLNGERNATSQISIFNISNVAINNGKEGIPQLHMMPSLDHRPEDYMWYPNATKVQSGAPAGKNSSDSSKKER